MAMLPSFPRLHNAAWPGLVGKVADTENAPIDLDTMLRLTANAEVDGVRFDGIDLFITAPHVDIDSQRDDVQRLADKLANHNLVAGSLVAPIWHSDGGGSAMGSTEDRRRFLSQLRKTCAIGQQLRALGMRPHGIVRIDSAVDPETWRRDPTANQRQIADTFKEAVKIARDHGETLAAEGEICWGGMHSWRHMLDLLERVGEPETLGFQADIAHTLLYAIGYNEPKHAMLPEGFDFRDDAVLYDALAQLTAALRPWTTDLHIAQNDATVLGGGTHDKTGRHCLPDDPNGKLDITRTAGLWLRAPDGTPNRKLSHICWDGCMFPNAVMLQQETWNKVLATMIEVSRVHGWSAGA